MDVKKLALLFGALVIAGVTAFMAKSMFTGAAAPQAVARPAAPVGPEILVATRTLPVGTIINAEAFRYQPWPEGLVQDAYFVRGEENGDPSSLIGSVVRTEVNAGQPATRGALIRPGERGFLAAALGPGMRAVTVSVSETSGVAGFVFPGDRIDLMLTQEVEGGGDGEALNVSETILRNIRVLAVDQRINTRDENGNQVARNRDTVTLEGTPRMAEKIAVAQRLGAMSLSLRSIADDAAELERAIAAGEVEVPEGDDPNAERTMMAAVASRPSEGSSTYTVGGDVSRFERSSVPGTPPREGEVTYTGPTVNIARGNNSVRVPVGAR